MVFYNTKNVDFGSLRRSLGALNKTVKNSGGTKKRRRRKKTKVSCCRTECIETTTTNEAAILNWTNNKIDIQFVAGSGCL